MRKDGTIHVRPIRGSGLVTGSFTKRQTPVVVVTLQGSKPLENSESFPASNATNPEWGHDESNSMELYYNPDGHVKAPILIVDVYSNSYKDVLLGSGEFDASEVVKRTTREPVTTTVNLTAKHGNKESRGKIELSLWFGPPPRKLVRVAMRVHRLLETRDYLVSAMCTIISGLFRKTTRLLHVDTIHNFAVRNKKLSIFVGGLMGMMTAGATGVFLCFAVPTGAIALFTFPLWIIPALIVSFLTAPFWIPLLVILGLFLGTVALIAFSVFITSHPVRRKMSMVAQKIKHTGVAEYLMYSRGSS